jgi:hypothetical protein
LVFRDILNHIATNLWDLLAIQNDRKKWQASESFPDRFDHTSKWYQTPDGKNGHTLAFSLFF